MDDKKKLMVVGALVVVVVGVGAFQMTSGGLSGPKEKPKGASQTAASKGTSKDGDGKKSDGTKFEIRNPVYASALAERDPFEEGAITNSVKPPEAKVQPRQQSRRNVPSGPGYQPLNPGGMLPGAINNGGGTSVQGAPPLRRPEEPTVTVTGVIMGTRPAVIFQDDQGNQRLVALGGEIDGGSRVTDISRGKVTVSRKGKTFTLTVGANTDGN